MTWRNIYLWPSGAFTISC